MTQKIIRASIVASGTVQGVGFRPFVYRIATTNNLSGYVRNRGDAGVEIIVQGDEKNVKKFLDELSDRKPPLARYDSLNVRYSEVTDGPDGFKILESSEARQFSGSVIPADFSICDECIQDLRRAGDRRHGYFFITCTNCGPRFTTILQVPYDRRNTTMTSFEMCPECSRDYQDPLDRRFNAQTIACPKCGPRALLLDNKGREVSVDDPIRFAGKLLERGSILAIKGNGGFHLGASSLNPEPLERLRKAKHRANKPFAVMARDLESAKSFAVINPEEERLLCSQVRPIVLLNKNSSSYFLSELVSPYLHNVGVMLPYSALQLLLFDEVKEEPAFVMTSANPPSEPIVKDNEDALRKLGNIVDYFLVHDREIAHRSDDSVMRVNSGAPMLIRRSRGYAPSPIYLKHEFKTSVLGVGAEFMATSCVSVANRAFISQHIGDMESVETYEFFKEATRHLMRLLNIRPERIACDLHPSISTTRLARRMSEELEIDLFQVQHHHAHSATLMAEHGIDEIIGVACDGAGYGTDGNIWGGEILECDPHGFRRVSHLIEQPMPGGDAAALYPLRMLAGILVDTTSDVESFLQKHADKLRERGKAEEDVALILEVIRRGKKCTKTTSTGRVLDAVASALEVCFERTYEGEPAIRLEAAATRGEDVLKLEPRIMAGNTLDTTYLLQEVFAGTKKYATADLAYSAHSYIAKGLAELAIDAARKSGISTIGFTGGVAYNEIISKSLRSMIEKEAGLKFITNVQIPAGDGGISVGQVYVANLLLLEK